MQPHNFDDGIAPPPRYLLVGVIGIFLLLVLGAVGGYILIQSQFSMSVLLQLAVIALPLVVLITIGAAIAFRKQLPRRFALWLTLGWVVLGIIGMIGFTLVFRNSLEPGQRETVKHYLPFMAIFAPPLPPVNSSLPTPEAVQSDITADDLLSSSFDLAPATTEPTTEPTIAIVVPPTDEPAPTVELTPSPVMQSLVTAVVTSAASATVPPTATSEPTVQNVPTDVPQPTQAAVSPVTVNQSVSQPQAPLTALLTGITPVKQGWNNCGPANITMALSYYGWTQSQDYALSYLKPDREDKNVNPWELVNFVNEQSQIRALYRVGGDMQLIKRLVSSGLPVLIETGYMFEGSDWLGHYQTVVGYDDTKQLFFVYDSYLGTGENGNGMPKTYEDFDNFWENFNRTFIVLYKPDEEGLVRSILGDRADVTKANELAAQTAQQEATANPQNAFAWFNLGSSLTRLGKYQQAAAAFDKARQVGLHWRMTLYQFTPFEAYFNVGRYEEIMSLTNANLLNGGQYVEETYYWQGKVYAAENDTAKASEAFRKALARNRNYTAAQDALNALS
ncbi:MAG: C39 family peptidase [Chloroflexi bacterium]|nr:C39 family peptidase [Chloroflexota bacterium]MCC6893576.1 C39 family peptidase [Anaerolineae bacterium]